MRLRPRIGSKGESLLWIELRKELAARESVATGNLTTEFESRSKDGDSLCTFMPHTSTLADLLLLDLAESAISGFNSFTTSLALHLADLLLQLFMSACLLISLFFL